VKRAESTRGAALPETALVMTASLAMAFGIIQIGIIGFLQIVVDGAAFIAAHEYAIGNTATSGAVSYQTYAQSVFPVATSSPTIQTNLPDPTTVAVNYNTNLDHQRHGGVSLMLGDHSQATFQRTAPTGLLGVGTAALSGISVRGAAIEPSYGVSNTAYDADGNGYTTPSALSSYATNAQNAPANYISQHVMSTCTASSFSTTCAGADTVMRSLGTAEFLDQDNWARTNLGVGPYTSGYTFAEMLCHQQTFAGLAATTFSSTAALPNVSTALSTVNSWDVLASSGGYPSGETALGQYPLHPALGTAGACS
jgi:hypothetical protein